MENAIEDNVKVIVHYPAWAGWDQNEKKKPIINYNYICKMFSENKLFYVSKCKHINDMTFKSNKVSSNIIISLNPT